MNCPRTFIVALGVIGMLSACQRDQAAAAAPQAPSSSAPAARPAPVVSVTAVNAAQRDLPVRIQVTGTVVPMASVEVKPQITAVVRAVHVKEGDSVRRGAPLFTLDARADEANVARLRAQMQKDEALLADARRQHARSVDLKARNFVAQGAVDTAQAQVEGLAATVAADRAALEAAQLNLSYAQISAPSAGRVGAVPVYPGSLVTANQTALLTITQLDPVEVAFSVPQRHLSDVLAAQQSGGGEVSAALPDQAAVTGRLSFVDSQVDASAGTVKLKARFANREARLWPGAYVKVEMELRTLKDAVVVPQASLIQSARGPLVYVIEDGKAQPRPVKLLHGEGDLAAVSGLPAGARVILDGRQNVRPDTAVVERDPAAAKGAGKEGRAREGKPQ